MAQKIIEQPSIPIEPRPKPHPVKNRVLIIESSKPICFHKTGVRLRSLIYAVSHAKGNVLKQNDHQ